VVLITIDTLRADATGFSGAGKVATPVIDRLAASGRVATFAHAHAVMTLPSHASLLTGFYPYQHGVRDNAGFRLPTTVTTLAERLKSQGYATAAFVSAFPLDRRFGLDAGFDVYDDEYEGRGAGTFAFAERPGDETVARALAWWKAHRGAPRFLWVHLFTPHFPYEPAEPFAERYAGRPYFGDVAMADAELEPLVARLLDGEDGSTLVVLTSDHGEALGDHGEETHGLFAYESTLRVPLVFWARGLVEPGRDPRPARHVDVVPSLLDLLGLPVPEDLPGRSLFSPDAGTDDEGCYFEALTGALNRGWAPLHGWIEGRTKAIRLPLPELYDLERDPGETDNRADAESERLARLLSRIPRAAAEPVKREAIDSEIVERLRSLGYVASSGPALAEAADDPALDPKNLIHVERLLYLALTAYNRGEPETAIERLNEIVAEQPRMAVAYSHLSFIYAELGRAEEAIELLRGARARGVDSEELRRQLALNLLALGDVDGAAEALADDSDSEDPETQAVLGRIAGLAGRDDEARARFERSLELDPTFPEAWIDMGILALGADRLDDAMAYLNRGLGADPNHAEGWNALGVVHGRRGDPSSAIESWRRSIELDPRLADALFNLGFALGKAGELDEAAALLERYAALTQGDERQRALRMLDELETARAGTVRSR
jgi:arylsulfatase A-like enzyme/Tfp pilus assembly protein PilF